MNTGASETFLQNKILSFVFFFNFTVFWIAVALGFRCNFDRWTNKKICTRIRLRSLDQHIEGSA